MYDRQSMTCGSCGAENPGGADFCAACGHSFRAVAPTFAGAGSPFADGVVETDRTNPNLPTAAQGGLIAGRYELLSILGTGGTGVVYRARDTELGEEVAIKILPPVKEGGGDTGRLKREIVAARKITHPNVIRLHEFGLSVREGFISMEILPGGTLAERIAAGPLPIGEALRIGIGVCEGLAAAHAEGIIHRDVKPQNVLFDKAGRPKIVDFGLARGTEVTSNTVGFSGTPQYMSPESAEGLEITEKSDVYSLGVMLFELFTGRRPFLAPSLGRLVTMHTKEKPPSLRSIRPELPVEVEEVVLRALEKVPAARTQGAAEIAAALRRLQATIAPLDAAADARARAAAGTSTTRPLEPQPLTLVRGVLPRARRRGAALAGGGALFAAGLVAAWAAGLFGGGSKPAATATPPATSTAVAANTPAAAGSPEATRAPATPRRTPVAAKTADATAAPTSTRVAAIGRKGRIEVRSKQSWVSVTVDGRLVDRSTPMPGPYALPAGKHRVVVENKPFGFRREVTVEIRPDRLTVVHVDPKAGVVRVSD